MLNYSLQVAEKLSSKRLSPTSRDSLLISMFKLGLPHAYVVRIISILTYKVLSDFLVPYADSLGSITSSMISSEAKRYTSISS